MFTVKREWMKWGGQVDWMLFSRPGLWVQLISEEQGRAGQAGTQTDPVGRAHSMQLYCKSPTEASAVRVIIPDAWAAGTCFSSQSSSQWFSPCFAPSSPCCTWHGELCGRMCWFIRRNVSVRTPVARLRSSHITQGSYISFLFSPNSPSYALAPPKIRSFMRHIAVLRIDIASTSTYVIAIFSLIRSIKAWRPLQLKSCFYSVSVL